MQLSRGAWCAAVLGSGGQPWMTGADSVTITNSVANQIFQRSAGNTSGPVTVSGTYTIASTEPTAIQVKILLTADDTTVVDWTTLDASPLGGNFSGTVTTPQGGPYYRQVRFSNAVGVTDEDDTDLRVGGIIIGYGQSNWLNHVSTTSSPPAANSNTRYFDGSSWTTVPVGNGIRELLNFLATDTGIPWGLVSGGTSGVPIASLRDGTAPFEALQTAIATMGGDAEVVALNQGEGDANGSGSTIATWDDAVDALHGELCALTGRTKAQMPLVVAGIATNSASDGTDANWTAMQAKQIEADTDYANIYYSHSNIDATRVDAYHYDAASYGKSGRRYAQTIADILGTETLSPRWFIASAAIVDTTHTDVTVTHSMGTDFTPTSGITGFEVSDDNGANWETPSAAARQSATVIRLTHSSMATTDDRLIRYMYGRNPTHTDPVLDNSAIAAPLNPSAGQTITAEGSASLPVPTFQAKPTATAGATFNFTVSSIGGFAGNALVIFGISCETNRTFVSGIMGASGGDVSLTQVANVQSGSEDARTLLFVQGVLPAGETFTTFSVTVSSAAFNNAQGFVWTCPVADLSSTTPLDTASDTDLNATVSTADLDTDAGGFILAIAINTITTTQSCVISGDETYAERGDELLGSAQHCAADASGTADTSGAATNTVTATFNTTGDMALLVASWR